MLRACLAGRDVRELEGDMGPGDENGNGYMTEMARFQRLRVVAEG